MKIGILSNNDVGISFGLLCEKQGYQVVVYNENEDYVFNLNQKICITDEPLIQSLLFDAVNLSATTNSLDVIKNSDIIFSYITPSPNIEGDYDTRKVFEIVADFYTLSSLDVPLYGKKFIVCSVTNPGDTEQIQQRLNMFNVQVAYNPLNVSHGDLVNGLKKTDCILIGTEYNELSNELIEIYNKILSVPVNVYIMSFKAAEITKLAISSFVATKISYANMVGSLMSKMNLEKETNLVLTAIGGDSRVGNKSLNYGFGFGGPLLPNENRALGVIMKNLDENSNLPLFVDTINKEHASFLKDYYIKQNPNKEIPFVIEYISYKKGTVSMDESQRFQLCIDLLNEGYYINVIEVDSLSKKLNLLSESYDNRLKFFKPGTNPQGYKITI